jgi:phthiocerol/phenolphthiocerol synthesis type-I polyketide synthase E
MSPARQWPGKIAIVSAALRLPGARSLSEFGRSLDQPGDSITRSDDARSKVVPMLNMPNGSRFINAYASVDEPTFFDPSRFGMTPAEALLTDPQQRLLLELADEALHTGAMSLSDRENAAVFVGVGPNDYDQSIRREMSTSPGVDDFAIDLGTSRDYVAGKIAYRLNLHGPAVTLLGACSTGLVAIHNGCRALLSGDVDVVLAGAAAVRFPSTSGYWATPGSISSVDGYCRPFDDASSGTVPGDGAALVILKRLEDAISSDDDILAVIDGSAVNNDGRKTGFGSVSASAQAEVISNALFAGGIDAADVAYVESHGTATRLGDAVEWSTLHKIYGSNPNPVLVGSLKGNIGHTREAAGIAGLLKVVLSLRRGAVPRSAGFRALPSDLRIDGTALTPVSAVAALPSDRPVHAAVSAFGLGGTNAHLILSAHNAQTTMSDEDQPERGVILLSSHSPETLERDIATVHSAVEADDSRLEDIASASLKRAHIFPFRHWLPVDFAQRTVGVGGIGGKRSNEISRRAPAVVFSFPGLGSEHVGMGAELALTSTVFRDSLTATIRLCKDEGVDISHIFEKPASHPAQDSALTLKSIRNGSAAANDELPGGLPVAHLALFAVQLAYADMLADSGVIPTKVVGHSLGEWTAATVAGALSRRTAVKLIAQRAVLVAGTTGGVTLAVAADAATVETLLAGAMGIAAQNSPNSCTVSGPRDALDRVETTLADAGIRFTRLSSEAAFHSDQLIAVSDQLRQIMSAADFGAPQITFISSVSAQVVRHTLDADYWSTQLVAPVRFEPALRTAITSNSVLVEIGPGTTRQWAMQTMPGVTAVRTSRTSIETTPDAVIFTEALARIWATGISPRWRAPLRPHTAPPLVPALSRSRFEPEPERTLTPIVESLVSAAGDPPHEGRSPEPDLRLEIETLWSGLLGVPDLSDDDHFFELGGDSLLGRHLIARIDELVGLRIPSSVVFASGTLAGMAESVTQWVNWERNTHDE